MYVNQRKEKQHLKCESCDEWKDDWFCDWELWSKDRLVICSKCGHREAIRTERKLIKVHNPKVVRYKKVNTGKINEHKQNYRKRKTDSLF